MILFVFFSLFSKKKEHWGIYLFTCVYGAYKKRVSGIQPILAIYHLFGYESFGGLICTLRGNLPECGCLLRAPFSQVKSLGVSGGEILRTENWHCGLGTGSLFHEFYIFFSAMVSLRARILTRMKTLHSFLITMNETAMYELWLSLLQITRWPMTNHSIL